MIGVLYRKKSPHWGEYQFLSRLKSQVSLARYYELLDRSYSNGGGDELPAVFIGSSRKVF